MTLRSISGPWHCAGAGCNDKSDDLLSTTIVRSDFQAHLSLLFIWLGVIESRNRSLEIIESKNESLEIGVYKIFYLKFFICFIWE